MKAFIVLSALILCHFSSIFESEALAECRTVVKYRKSFPLNPSGEENCNAYLAEIAATTEGIVLKSSCTFHTPNAKGDTYKYNAYVLKDIGPCN